MTSVLVSSSSFCAEDEIVRRTAEALGYPQIGDELFGEAAERFGVAREAIVEAATEPQALFGMARETRQECLAFLGATLAHHMLGDGVVYDGPAGHLLIRGIPHFVRVSITGSIEERAAAKAQQDGQSVAKAKKTIEGEDRRKRTWAQQMGNVDLEDPDLHDLVVDATDLGVERAVEKIVATAQERRFQPTTYSRQSVKNLELAARVRAALIQRYDDIRVRCEDDAISMRIRATKRTGPEQIEALRGEVRALSGVEDVQIDVTRDSLGKPFD